MVDFRETWVRLDGDKFDYLLEVRFEKNGLWREVRREITYDPPAVRRVGAPDRDIVPPGSLPLKGEPTGGQPGNQQIGDEHA